MQDITNQDLLNFAISNQNKVQISISHAEKKSNTAQEEINNLYLKSKIWGKIIDLITEKDREVNNSLV